MDDKSGNIGATWIRSALQVNPYSYHGKNAPSSTFSTEEEYNAALLAKCHSNNIGMIAITDHWAIDSAQQLIHDAEAEGVVALPGFEANTSEGIHLLVIFERGTEAGVINAAIGACRVSPGCANGTTGAPYAEMLAEMTKRDALVIPAHVNVSNSGMLTGRSGAPLVGMIKDPNLHAIAVTPSVTDGTDQALIAKGTPPYDRTHPLTIVYSDDISHPNALDTEGAATWFKVSSPCLSSLKLAVRTPLTRVSTADPSTIPRALIREISWTGGFLDGVTVPLAEDLTSLIGGRGTGKSTVIETLRYVLGIEPLGAQTKNDHESIISGVLRSGTTARIRIDVVDPAPAHYVIERSVPNPPVVIDSAGAATGLRPEDAVGIVEIFGQHELAELAQDKPSVARMLGRFAGHADRDEERDRILAHLKENRENIDRAEEELSSLDEELADLPRLEAQANRYEESDLAVRLQSQKRLEQDQALFGEADERLEVAKKTVSKFRAEDVAGQLKSAFEDCAESTHPVYLTSSIEALTGAASYVEAAIASMETALQEAQAKVVAAKAGWTTDSEAERAGHAEILRTLVEEGLEPEKYLTVTSALEKLKAKGQRRGGLETQISEVKRSRATLLGKLHNREKELLEQLHEAVRAANHATDGVVIVKPVASPDRNHIRDIFIKYTSGARTQIMAAVESEGFSPRHFVESVRSGSLETTYGIKGAQAASISAAGEPLLRSLEETTVGQAVDVLLDVSAVKGQREHRRLDELSKGQRSTALLLLLLGASSSPLIIDQPEDDLDNRFVYDGIVQKLRGLKGRRQIIASTHNANVPVLGDSELVVALESDGQRGWPIKDGIGSLDGAKVRELAEDLLEGGRTAFDARQHLYGF